MSAELKVAAVKKGEESATQQVLGTIELFQAILSHLPLKDHVVAYDAAPKLREAIKASPTLHAKMSHRGIPANSTQRYLLDQGVWGSTEYPTLQVLKSGEQPVIEDSTRQKVAMAWTLNSFICQFDPEADPADPSIPPPTRVFDYLFELMLNLRLNSPLATTGGTLGRMFIAQPPPTTLTVSIAPGEGSWSGNFSEPSTIHNLNGLRLDDLLLYYRSIDCPHKATAAFTFSLWDGVKVLSHELPLGGRTRRRYQFVVADKLPAEVVCVGGFMAEFLEVEEQFRQDGW